MQIELFITENKRNPVLDFINKQEKKDQATILGVFKVFRNWDLRLPGLNSDRSTEGSGR